MLTICTGFPPSSCAAYKTAGRWIALGLVPWRIVEVDIPPRINDFALAWQLECNHEAQESQNEAGSSRNQRAKAKVLVLLMPSQA